MTIKQWQALHDGTGYVGVNETIPKLPPGLYDLIAVPQVGVVWAHVEVRNDLLLKFPDSPSASVVDEIALFWAQEDNFKRHGLPYKRGILLHGPPGSGKSATLRLVAEDVVKAGGYVIMFARPEVLIDAVRQLRAVHPDARVVVLMEDIDAILENSNESNVLNLLDGAEEVDKMVFLATTNYPEKLKARISNRPSRFDRRVLIPHPGAESRRLYLETLVRDGDDFDLDRYARDSANMSLAHLKELFVSTAILGGDYDATLAELKAMMRSRVSSVNDEGFEPGGYF